MPVAALLCLAALLLVACSGDDADLRRFRATLGEHDYAIELGGRLQGRMSESRSLDAEGRPRILTITDLQLPGTGATTRTERLRFAADPPHAMLEHSVRTRDPAGRVSLRILPVQGHLGDHLGTGEADQLGNGRRADGAAVSLTLGADGLPEEYRIGSSFVLRRVAELPPMPGPARREALTVPAAARLGPRNRVDSLRVRIRGPAAALFTAGPGLAVTREAGSGDGAAPSTRLHSTRLRAPEGDPDRSRRIRRLIAAVRDRLTYVPGASPPDMEALLDTGEGDCWEFAALFDALARRAGLDSRTVTGLAWMGDQAGAFGLHAWNEVRVQGTWVAVDPTFDESGADAARLRFPDDPATQLDLQYALAASRIEVLSVNGTPAPTGAGR